MLVKLLNINQKKKSIFITFILLHNVFCVELNKFLRARV